MDIIALLDTVNVPLKTSAQSIEVEYKTLFDAVERHDLVAIKQELQDAPYYIQVNIDVFHHFLQHFNPKSMTVLFDCNFDYNHFEAIFSSNAVVPPVFWQWFNTYSEDARYAALDMALTTLGSSTLDTTSAGYQSCLNMLEAHIQITDASFLLKEFHLTRGFNQSWVLNWDQRMWDLFAHCTVDQWSDFLHNRRPAEFLKEQNPENLKFFQVTLQNVTNFKTAFDNHYHNMAHVHQTFLDNYSCPEGIEQSKGFQHLSACHQQQLIKEIEHHYISVRDRTHTAMYQHVLGYTPEELFLGRFGFHRTSIDDPSLSYLAYPHSEKSTHPMQDLLSSFHGLRAIGPEGGSFILQHLDNAVVLENMFDDIAPLEFSELLSKHPILSDWKDCKGNSLAHWCAVNGRTTREMAEVFVQHPPLLEPNCIGCTVCDILMVDLGSGHGLDNDVLPVLQNYYLSKEVAGDVKPQRNRKM